MSVMQGGCGFPFMAYNYLCTGDSTGISVPNDKVPSHTLCFALEKVCMDIATVRAFLLMNIMTCSWMKLKMTMM